MWISVCIYIEHISQCRALHLTSLIAVSQVARAAPHQLWPRWKLLIKTKLSTSQNFVCHQNNSELATGREESETAQVPASQHLNANEETDWSWRWWWCGEWGWDTINYQLSTNYRPAGFFINFGRPKLAEIKNVQKLGFFPSYLDALRDN